MATPLLSAASTTHAADDKINDRSIIGRLYDTGYMGSTHSEFSVRLSSGKGPVNCVLQPAVEIRTRRQKTCAVAKVKVEATGSPRRGNSTKNAKAKARHSCRNPTIRPIMMHGRPP